VLPQPRDESRFVLCPLSLAATYGIDVSFFSSGYLDVSVPQVSSDTAIHSPCSDGGSSPPCFHIQKSPDRRSFASFPEHIAGYHVFRRLSMPRHPPYTLSSLTTFIDHRHRRAVRNGRRSQQPSDTINNVPYRQKGARRYPLDLTDEKTVVGITTMQDESRLRTSRRITRIAPASSAALQTDARRPRPVRMNLLNL
jgi:hypothetical protein